MLFALPEFTFASSSAPTTLHDLLTKFIAVKLDHYIPFLIILASLIFLVGVVRFVGAGDSEEARQSGRNVMIFGIIVLFVMFSVWGIVRLVYGTFFNSGLTLPDSLPCPQPCQILK